MNNAKLIYICWALGTKQNLNQRENMQGIIHEKEKHSNAKTYSGLEKMKGKKALGTQKVNIKTLHEIQMSSVFHHTGELMRADAAVAQGAKSTTTAECEQGCSVPTGQNRPLHLKTQSLTHTHSRSSQLTYIKANHSGSLNSSSTSLAHTNIWLRMRIKPGTYTDSIHAILGISIQKFCHLYQDRTSIKQNEGLIINGIFFLSSWRSHIDFHTNSI